MTNCPCGKEVRLRAVAVTMNRRRGVSHWIEHIDGTRACGDAEHVWSCAALKPYAKDESQRESAKLKRRWEAFAEPPTVGAVDPVGEMVTG